MVWLGMVWYGMVWRGMVWYGVVWYDMAWYIMVCYDMAWYGTVWYDTIRYAFASFSPTARFLSRVPGCRGARRRPACALRRAFGPQASSAARVLGVQSHASRLSRDRVPPRPATQDGGSPNDFP